MERDRPMKNILLTCAAVMALATPALAQGNESKIRDGVRHLTPKDAGNDDAKMIESRAIDMGFFSWPVPTEKVAADQLDRPRAVSDCKGHDPDYRPAHDYSSKDEWSARNTGLAKTFIYEWMAYGNAIEARDCTCASLTADWDEAVASFEAMVAGIENFRLYTAVPGRMRNAIKRDYNQMCDVRMQLDLG